MPAFIQFKCKCGRNLRAKEEQGGTTVRCWDCRAEVLVPKVKTGDKLARESLKSARAVLVAETVFAIFLGAIAFTGALAIPRVGLLVAFGLILIAAAFHSRNIGRSGRQGVSRAAVLIERSRSASVLRWVLIIVAGAGLLAPFVLRHLIMDGLGLMIWLRGIGVAAVALLCWLVFPLVLLACSACDRAGALSARQALAATRKHPLGTATALLVLPLGLIFVELALLALTWQQGWIGDFVSDLFPTPGALRYSARFTALVPFDSSNTPDRTFLELYTQGLRKGFTLLGAIPASLPRGIHTRFGPGHLNILPRQYLAVRCLYSVLILTGVGCVLAIQSRWLGLIPAIDSRRTAESTTL